MLGVVLARHTRSGVRGFVFEAALGLSDGPSAAPLDFSGMTPESGRRVSAGDRPLDRC